MKGIDRRHLAGLLVPVLIAFAGAAPAQQAPERSITKIAGELYRFQNRFHYSVFLVTPAGIIATDPINADAARWLKAELAKRFGRPVKYLILSHDHADHSSGGEVFAETALVVAHENAKQTIIGEKRPTAVPNITFSDRMTIELGGKRVELIYVGRNHSDNSIVMRFPAARALFAVDFIPVRTLAFRNLSDSYHPDWIASLKRVEAVDFDILVPGHGRLGKKEDVRAFRGYMEDLYAEVLKHARAGRSLEEMQRLIKLQKYRDWGRYEEWLRLNIAGVYNHVRLHRRGN